MSPCAMSSLLLCRAWRPAGVAGPALSDMRGDHVQPHSSCAERGTAQSSSADVRRPRSAGRLRLPSRDCAADLRSRQAPRGAWEHSPVDALASLWVLDPTGVVELTDQTWQDGPVWREGDSW